MKKDCEISTIVNTTAINESSMLKSLKGNKIGLQYNH